MQQCPLLPRLALLERFLLTPLWLEFPWGIPSGQSKLLLLLLPGRDEVDRSAERDRVGTGAPIRTASSR
jgi:hypothetical protein